VPRYAPELPQLQDRLGLFRFSCAQLGAPNGFAPLRDWLKNAQQGFADDGHSHFFHVLVAQSGLKLPEEKLSEYDLRIKRYVERLNAGCTPAVQLLYFQWLAALVSEIFLDRLFTDADAFRDELNAWLNSEPLFARGLRFEDVDLTKVAFWMATGSGKTLLMHINLLQTQHHAARAGRKFDNVLLVTPNEGLSRQHLSELSKSEIAARHYGESTGGLFASDLPVTVIEITKLTENKRGGGLSVDVEAFGPNNLLLVDEGHRGASGDVWRALRQRVAEQGFTFEYSATFGQIVNGASPEQKRKDLLAEYSRAILFDYSYPHFYEDGYGKDYWVVNVRDETDTFNVWIILANLLSFLEQTLAFAENKQVMRGFAVERPLWVFVGHSVTGGKTREDQLSLTDVEQIVAFFDKFLKDASTWSKRIEQLLAGKSGLKNSVGEDVFADKFASLRAKGCDGAKLYDRIVQRVFGGRAGETLRAARLKAAEGEIGLRVGADRPYFGVINVGDVSGLIDLLQAGGIATEEDTIHARSLFDKINEHRSPVNVLIGARKFMEGWDSFRVASMGLMNIGRGEGSQIIQLFGRGVRLHGKNNSLKRSSALQGGAALTPLRLTETLTVFGVRANYMQRFREELRREGIETDFETVEVPIRVEEKFLKRGLQVLRLPEGSDFTHNVVVAARVEDAVRVTLDLRPKMEVAESAKRADESGPTGGEDRAERLREYAVLLNWEQIYFDLLDYKITEGLSNVSFTSRVLRDIISRGHYRLYCNDRQLPTACFGDLRRIGNVTITLLRKYLARLYDHERRSWERKNLRLRDLTAEDSNVNFHGYAVTTNAAFANRVRELVRKGDELYRKDLHTLPTIHFDRHLYQPLLAFDHQKRIETAPPLLNEGETRLVRDLREFFKANPNEHEGREVFLLRNLSVGRGVGFFSPKDGEAFYPDFILWVIADRAQTIAFIDPHGLGRARGLSDPKIRLHRRLTELQPTLQAHCATWDVHLTSFVVSPTAFDEMQRSSWIADHTREELETEHVLFQESPPAYVGQMWKGLPTR
jgi:hypothetical protein